MSEQLLHDDKAKASLTFGDVIRQTANNFPDRRFRPKSFRETTHYTIAAIKPGQFSIYTTADGIGTKPELAERLYTESLRAGKPTPEVFESLALDTLAMIDGDEARFGRFMVGAANVIDTNTADDKAVIQSLAKGLKSACDAGRFALLNGETAELGYRTAGYGKSRINWNAVGISIVNPEKLILGQKLKPGQPVVAFREESIRSNGLSKARAVLEADYLHQQKLASKDEYLHRSLQRAGVVFDRSQLNINTVLSDIFGHDASEQVLVPWHTTHPDITRQLLMPSRLYGPVLYEAQGGVDGQRKVDMIAAAHITGGGIPEKAKRMVESKKLGVDLDPAVFPIPEAVTSLLRVAGSLPEDTQRNLMIDGRTACEQWNMGAGFLVVTRDKKEARKLVDLADANKYEAKMAGEITDKRQISWRGFSWSY